MIFASKFKFFFDQNLDFVLGKQDALKILEAEREKHKREQMDFARTAVGLAKFEDYDHLERGKRDPVSYRKDLYGMDESWKEYNVHPPRRPRPGGPTCDPFKPSVRNVILG